MRNLFNFSAFFTFIGRNKGYTVINALGLSVSLMFVILISIYTTQELSVDAYQEKGDRICVLASDSDLGTALPIGDRLKARYPEVEAICPTTFRTEPVSAGAIKTYGYIGFVEKNFFDFFSFPLLAGDKERVLEASNSVVLSEQFSAELFGAEDPLGKTIQIGTQSFTVNGISKKIKNSVIPDCELFVQIDQITPYNNSITRTTTSNADGVHLFLLEKQKGALASKTADVLSYFKTFFWVYQREVWKEVAFVPLGDVYFSSEEDSGNNLRQGDYSFVLFFIFIGVLILLFAVTNYINLTVAQSGFRAKEMATRRLMGASRKEVFVKVILESVLLTAGSSLLALFLASVAAPYAEQLLQTKLYFADVLTLENLLLYVLMVVVLGTIAGLLPALVNAKTDPIEVVRGAFRRKTKMSLSRVFITLQNVITISFVAASITVMLQFEHLVTAPLGYNTEEVLVLWEFRSKEELYRLVNELKRLPQVQKAGIGQSPPTSGGEGSAMVINEKNVNMRVLAYDNVAADILGIEILQQNGTNGCYLTERAMKEVGADRNSTTFTPDGSRPYSIAGIVRDFHLNSILDSEQPVMLDIASPDVVKFEPWCVYVEVKGDLYTARNEVEKVFDKLFDTGMDADYLKGAIERKFSTQKRMAILVSVFTVIAIVISLLGLLAMSTYFIQQRTSEIAIRKVFGSTEAQVLKKLIGVFLSYVGIAFVIAVPIIWYVMSDWLSGYSYRIALSPWIFVGAGLFCFMVSFAAVFVQSYRAANANPVKNIRVT